MQIWEMVGLWHYTIPGFFLLAQFGLGMLVALGNLVNNSVFLYLSEESSRSSNERSYAEGNGLTYGSERKLYGVFQLPGLSGPVKLRKMGCTCLSRSTYHLFRIILPETMQDILRVTSLSKICFEEILIYNNHEKYLCNV